MPASVPPKLLRAPRRRTSRRCPAGCPACRCRSSEPAVIWPYMVRPRRSRRAELLPGRPVADQVGVGDQHARRPLVGAEDADRLARLHEQRLVVLERRAACARSRRSRPSCGPPCPCRRRRPARRGARRPRGRGCSCSMRSAASCGQPFAVRVVPRGARTSRLPVMPGLPSPMNEHIHICHSGATGQPGRRGGRQEGAAGRQARDTLPVVAVTIVAPLPSSRTDGIRRSKWRAPDGHPGAKERLRTGGDSRFTGRRIRPSA